MTIAHRAPKTTQHVQQSGQIHTHICIHMYGLFTIYLFIKHQPNVGKYMRYNGWSGIFHQPIDFP